MKPKTRFSERLLTRLCKHYYLEEILGDLAEYRDELNQKAAWKRRAFYWFHVINFLQPWALKSLGGTRQLNSYGMFKNYFKTSLRSLKSNALFSFINITGLSISMSVGLLMIVFLTELSSFDDFHEKKDRIYRVTSSQIQGRGVMVHNAAASYFMADLLENQVPGVERVLVMTNTPLTVDLKTEEKAMPVTGYFADASFFEVFSFELIKGNPATALTNPNGVILTETTAQRLFGDVDPMGKPLTAINDSYLQNGQPAPADLEEGIVTGILKDLPLNSHLQFEMLVSLSTLDRRIQAEGRTTKTNPGAVSAQYVYLVLNENARVKEIEEAMAGFLVDFNAERADNPLVHHLQPMRDFVTDDHYYGGGPSFSQERVYVMVGLCLIVLLSACFNYTNLSLARGLRRSKEVGVRKVNGATRFQVFSQFVVEAMVLSMLALIMAFLLFQLIRPEFLKLPNPSGTGSQMFSLELNAWQLLYFFLFALIVGFVAGFLPALFQSKLKATVLFRGADGIKIFAAVNLRKLLVVFQFALSIGLIMCAVMVDNQYRFTLNYDLGYTTEEILTVDVQGDYIAQLENAYAAIPQIQQLSKSGWVLGVGGDGLSAGMIFSEDRQARSLALINHIDERYLAMHDLELLAGSGFTRSLGEGETAKTIIVNEAFLNTFSLGNANEAIGKKVLYNGAPFSILGVVEEPVSIGLTKKFIEPFAFMQANEMRQYKSLNLRLKSGDLPSVYAELERIYEEFDAVHPFTAVYYEDRLVNTYRSEKATYSIVSFLAVLAISISTLGLLGMVVFTTESRIKEVSIRKVLGAGVRHLMLLLSKSFIAMILLAAAVAIPLTLYIVQTQVLDSFWVQAEVGLVHMASGFLIMLVIAALAISWQVGKAATKNPAEILRNE